MYVATGEGRKLLAIPDVAAPKNSRITLGQYAEMTLAYIHRLWSREVVLETVVNGKRTLLTFGERGFSAKASK